MMQIQPKNILFALTLLLSIGYSTVFYGATPPYEHNIKTIKELRVRDGLPHFFNKVKNKKEVTVAYLGGSITKAEGWRVKSFEWLETQYPKVKFNHVNASLSGTGADIGAARLEKYILPYKPDLLFIEYRVNSSGIKPFKGIEGIVRRVKEANPEVDICFVYTLGIWMTKTLGAGKQTGFGAKMEEIANYYGIPSIDFAPEVMKQLKENKLSFKVPKKEEGKLWFTKDNCHPTDEGHDLYRDIIARSFVKISKHTKEASSSIKSLPIPIHKDHYYNARFIPLSTKKLGKKWKIVDINNDDIYNIKNNRTKMMLGTEVIKTNKRKASFSVTWNGPYLGYSSLPNGKEIVLEVTVDGKEPEIVKVSGKSKYRGRTSSKMYYLKPQGPGEHTATFKIKEIKNGNYFYLGQFMELNPE